MGRNLSGLEVIQTYFTSASDKRSLLCALRIAVKLQILCQCLVYIAAVQGTSVSKMH